jgi:hypothetical protein
LLLLIDVWWYVEKRMNLLTVSVSGESILLMRLWRRIAPGQVTLAADCVLRA